TRSASRMGRPSVTRGRAEVGNIPKNLTTPPPGRSTRFRGPRETPSLVALELRAQLRGHRQRALGRVVVADLYRRRLDHQPSALLLVDLVAEGKRLVADPVAADADLEHFAHQRLGAEVDLHAGQDERDTAVVLVSREGPPILLAPDLEIGDVDRVVDVA